MNMVEQVTDYVKNYDEEVGKAIELELGRQRRNLELIASENIISPAVMMAMATVPANKYAEGYPGKRYYGGCENVDIVEHLTHGSPVNQSGILYNFVPYNINDDGVLDYDEIR